MTSSIPFFKNLDEAKKYAMENPGSTFIKNPDGDGFILKGSISPERVQHKVKQESFKREENIRHGRPANSGLTWRDKDLAKLLKLHSAGSSIDLISSQLERTELAISAKLRNLELISEEEHQNNSIKFSKTQS